VEQVLGLDARRGTAFPLARAANPDLIFSQQFERMVNRDNPGSHPWFTSL